MPGTFHSGKLATATINGNEPAVIGWTVTAPTEVVQFRNSKTGSFTVQETTFHNISGTITIDEDFDQSTFGSPLSLVTGAVITNLKLYKRTTAGDFWNIPSAVILDTPQSAEVNGRINTTIQWSGSGTFSCPGGATPS
jgi:hypothetical protein